MSCTGMHDQLGEYLVGALDRSARRNVESHLVECGACRSEWEGLLQLDSLLRELGPVVGKRRRSFRGRLARLAGGLAAGVLVVLTLSLLSKREVTPWVRGGALSRFIEGRWEERPEEGPLERGRRVRVDRGQATFDAAGHRLTAHHETVLSWEGSSTVRIERGVLHVMGNGKGLVIQTEAGRLEVLGTEFWVRVLEKESGMRKLGRVALGAVLGVAVTSGAVAVINSYGEVRLKGGQEALVAPDAAPRLVSLQKENEKLKKERDDLLRQVASPAGQDPAVLRLEKRAAELQRKLSGQKTLEEKHALAKEIWETITKSMSQDDLSQMQKAMEALSRLDELDEDVTPYFIGVYRKAELGEIQDSALMFALACGGQEATRLLKEHLQGQHTLGSDLMLVLGQLNPIVPIKGIHVDAELEAASHRLLQSEKAHERVGAAGILGWHDNGGSRVALQRLADADPDSSVRAAAIRALGRNGTRETLQYLESYPAPAEDKRFLVFSALEAAKKELKGKFPN